jgi:ATP-dependent Lon protease
VEKSDENEEDNTNLNSEDYNIFFTKFIIKNLFEMSNYIKEWEEFKEKKRNYMFDVDKILDKCVYGQTDAKKQMKRIIGQWMNGASKGQCFGLCGPPGVGKTTLCKNGLTKCLFDESGNSRPFAFLPLGGATNGSFLEGHHYTYLGSTWGKIVDILIETKCMNPIIYIDELDKISKTEHGKEIASILTHITDQSQNKEFYDKYFTSIPFDLSQILFIFSYNDKNNIDRILRDRIQEINIKPLTRSEKLIISKNYLCPEIYSSVGYAPDEIIIDKDALSVLVDEYTYEAGVRKLNEIIYDIVREMNLNKIMNISDVYPIHITGEYIKKFMEDKSRIRKKLIHHEPRVGLVNGLFATGEGMGGITIIQVMKTYSEKKLAIEKVTGSMGDVMKDSVNLALTMAWNILPLAMKEKINNSKEMMGLHIHCPDLSTSKDGPSASLAFCLAFISRLANIPVKNTVALTGEMDLLGNAMEIGGLESKLMGAINAGVETVLIPKENEDDLDIIMRKDKEDKELLIRNSSVKSLDTISFDENDKKRIFRGQLNVYIVENIYDVLEHALVSPIPRDDFERL